LTDIHIQFHYKPLSITVTRGPRTLKYYENPQILDGRLEVQMEWVRTLWGAPVDVGRHRSPSRQELVGGNMG